MREHKSYIDTVILVSNSYGVSSCATNTYKCFFYCDVSVGK